MKLNEIKTRYDIGHVLNEMGLYGVGAEIGVAFGENAEQILEYSELELLYLVDPWAYVEGQDPIGHGDMIKDWEGCYNYCMEKLQSYENKIAVLRMDSKQASKQIIDESLDFAYIDGNHMSPWIDNDLEYWYPKVKSGGIFGGHDYYNKHDNIYICNVKDAVDKFIEQHDLELILLPVEDSSWYVIKP